MPIFYDEISTLYKRDATEISFSFNDKEARGFVTQPLNITECYYEHVGGSAGVSTMVTIDLRDYLVEDYFISVVCEHVEAFVRHQTKKLTQFSLTILHTDGDQKTIETNVNRMCRCLEKSLQSRTEKLKVEHFSLSVLEISQAVSAVNLLDREILQKVTVRLSFENQVFKADDFIPLREGQQRQRFYLRIELHEFSLNVFKEMRKLLNYTSPLNCIHINYNTIDEKCLELIPVAYHSPDQKNAIFPIDHVDDPIKNMAMINLSDNKCHLNILEVPSIMRSIASNLGCRQIQMLRKMSRGIRECLDYVKPEPHIISYSIFLQNETTDIIAVMWNGEFMIRYEEFLEQEADRIVNDFDLNTRHQKSCMDELYIDCKLKEEDDSALSKFFKLLRKVLIWNLKEEDDSALSKFFKLLRNVLISRKSPLKVKQLKLVAHWKRLVMNILPYLDADFLECIIIFSFKTDEEYAIDLDEISRTEQWSKAKELCMKTLTVRTSIQDLNILNFERIDITLETMLPEDITYCRKNLPQSPVFKKFNIHINDCSTEDFLATLGQPYRVVDDIKYIWYFRIENTPKYLHVVLEKVSRQTEGRLHFAKVLQEDTPFF